jgi:hypothetical protein
MKVTHAPLHLAVEGGDVRRTVEVVIGKGANVKAKSSRGATLSV